MTSEEAVEVLRIMIKADGECPYCGRTLFHSFVTRWPEFMDEARKVWREIHDSELDEDTWGTLEEMKVR